MNKAIPLSELFHITSRFHRSVHLERDFYGKNALEGYVLTVTARETLQRLIAALEDESTSKVWSLTGPYGSGKSAFALFAAKLLGDSESPTTQAAMKLLKHGDESLWDRFIGLNLYGRRGFCPVLISGERSPIALALLRGLERGLIAFGDSLVRSGATQYTSLRPLLLDIQKRLDAAENGRLPHASEITGLFESATHQIDAEGGSGLLLIVDELGKFLEYAAQDPAYGDLFVLQSLAEFATRSGQTPLLMVTILHQAFEQYVQRLAISQREEWAKVQGRFEDASFIEPTEQVLRLIGSAIEKTAAVENPNLSVAADLELKPRQLDQSEFVSLLDSCLPLHPTVALIVSPLFRRFAQNERSLFALLNSSEPHGLQDFLATQTYDGRCLPTFTLSNLYDYIYNALGSGLYTSREGAKWAQIESAIERLSNPSPMTVKLIKTIGLLGIVGETSVNLKASKALLRYALDGMDTLQNEPVQSFENALEILEQRSIVIYRRYSDAYALWEGSDIDIEARLREAREQLDSNLRLPTALSTLTQPQPLIARRHLFVTGTLRYFAVRYTDLESFDADLHKPYDDADGLVLYALPANELEKKQLVKKATNASVAIRKEVLIAIPQSIGFLRDAVLELWCLGWVEENTPELTGDATARRELWARRGEAEREVSAQLTSLFSGTIASSQVGGSLVRNDTGNTGGYLWYHKGGRKRQITSRRTLNEYLSKICKSVYPQTPILRNELINRQQISSQAASARRQLIEAMLDSQGQERLGIKGYPPEMSIYLSLLFNTRIHRRVSGVWGFHPPKAGNKTRIYFTWQEIEKFLSKCEETRQSVATLYKRLEQPPFGLRSGPMPILLCAVLLHYKSEIALYEEGSFVADISMPVFERLIRSPEKFEIKRFRMEGIRAEVFEQFTGMISKPVSAEGSPPNLLVIVRALIGFIHKLPRYTMLTQDLSDAAIALRRAIADAREPDTLLFEQLPQALGFDAFGPSVKTDSKTVDVFFNALQDTLSELKQAYDDLLSSIEEMLVSEFSLQSDSDSPHTELIERASPLLDSTIDTQLKGFLIRICDEGLDFKEWVEAIGTYIAGKPPASWNDSDKAHFKMNLSELARKFHHFDALSFERQEQSDNSVGEVIRVGITTRSSTEQERVVTVPSTAEAQIDNIERGIEEVFESAGVDGNSNLRLAILARLSQKLMEQLEDSVDEESA
ncbi:hypothetical protein C6502_17240 [Candidatus Poribacteria bacterium]|nr:MAG: hypothetical protein C6502_17240 [Candidatus Poribacteria bacterium]